jgi:hypothetical protein
MKTSISRVFAVCKYLLPILHLCACLVIAIAKIESGWEQMIKIDFPFSLLLVALIYAKDHALLWFGVLGTLWWFFLPWFFWYVLTHYPPKRPRQRATQP